MERFFIASGALSMALSIMAGSFGAHGLKSYFESSPYHAEVFQKAVFYQMIHSLGLFLIAWLSTRWPSSFVTYSGFLFIFGIFLFSGSLYTLSLTKIKWLGAITPFGGLSFIIGWILLFVVAVKS